MTVYAGGWSKQELTLNRYDWVKPDTVSLPRDLEILRRQIKMIPYD